MRFFTRLASLLCRRVEAHRVRLAWEYLAVNEPHCTVHDSERSA